MSEQELSPPPELRNQKLVTVGRYFTLSEGLVARSVLEGCSIPCFLSGENAAWVRGANSTFESPADFGGLPLQVMPQDEERARQLLSQTSDASYETDTGEFVQPVCPQCGSRDIATYSGAVQGKPITDDEDAWQCRNCKCIWEDDGTGDA